MPATALRCRACATEFPLGQLSSCERCFAPLDPVYDWEELHACARRSQIEEGPSSLWRYAALLPVAAPTRVRLPVGLTPLIAVPRLAEQLDLRQLWLKLETSNPTHSFKDRVVAVAAAKARELDLRTLACSSTGNLANAVAARAAAEGLEAAVLCPSNLEHEKLLATAAYGASVYAIRGTYDDCSRLSIELSYALPTWGFVNVSLRTYYAEGSKTIAFEIAEQLGWRAPAAVVCPLASGSLFAKIYEGFNQLHALRLVRDDPPQLIGGQASGCAPIAQAFADRKPVAPVRPQTLVHSLAIGSPADGDLAIETAISSGGAIYPVAEDEVGREMAILAEKTGIFGETAAGVALGALRIAIANGDVARDSEVVLVVSGDGLKTPHAVDERLNLHEVDTDGHAILELVGTDGGARSAI